MERVALDRLMGCQFPDSYRLGNTASSSHDLCEDTDKDISESRVNQFISNCDALRLKISAEISESPSFQSDLQLERDQPLSPVKRPSWNRTRDLDNQSNFSKEEFDYPFNGKAIMQDMKFFFLWVFTGFKTNASDDLQIKRSVEAVIFSWDIIKEVDSVPYRVTAQAVVKASRSFIQIVTANATSASRHRVVLYSGAALAFVARSTNLEYLQWMAGAVSFIAFCFMGWSYASSSLDESEAKRSLKSEVDSYINEVDSYRRDLESRQRAVSFESGTPGLQDSIS